MKEQLKTLWKDTFGDPDAFVDLFFERVYEEENTWVYEKKGRIIAALHAIPYKMAYAGEIIPVSYICGVATLPEERGKGYMKQLMEETHEALRLRGNQLAVLLPASPGLFNYYSRLGYETTFFYESNHFYSETGDPHLSKQLYASREVPEEKIVHFLYRQSLKREYCILHSREDISIVLTDLRMNGGDAWVTTNEKNEIDALAFVSPAGEHIPETYLIKEMVYISPIAGKKLLQSICMQYNITHIDIRYPAETKGIPFGMSRIWSPLYKE